MVEKACRNCRLIMSQGDTCPICGQSSLTSKWSGYIVVLNVEKSEIAKKLGLKINGSYALHLNDT
ncbi:MAG: transcription elongation factor subunit Spt4 [Candidatus Micrarchaeales archaeon]|jgi:DNA-directed RNA polymerase subunit E"